MTKKYVKIFDLSEQFKKWKKQQEKGMKSLGITWIYEILRATNIYHGWSGNA